VEDAEGGGGPKYVADCSEEERVVLRLRMECVEHVHGVCVVTVDNDALWVGRSQDKGPVEGRDDSEGFIIEYGVWCGVGEGMMEANIITWTPHA
jgi:hypothetical protein